MRTALKRLILMRGGFSPTSIPGLQLWLDAADAGTLFQDSAGTTPAAADNDVVGYWGDKSGNGYHATQSSTSQKPAVRIAQQNSKNVLAFATDDVLELGDVLDPRSNSIAVFVVGRKTSGATGGYFSKSIAGVGTGRYALFYDTNLFGISDLGGAILSPSVVRAGGSFEIAGIVVDRSVMSNRLIVNGTTLATATTSPNTTDYQPAYVAGVGAYRNGGNNGWFNYLTGNIAEVLVYLRTEVLSANEIAAITAYLNSKWAVY